MCVICWLSLVVISVEDPKDKKEADKMLTVGAAVGCVLVVIVALCAWQVTVLLLLRRL